MEIQVISTSSLGLKKVREKASKWR